MNKQPMDVTRDYRVKMSHDRGTITFRIRATSATSAAERICALENAPRRAVLSVR